MVKNKYRLSFVITIMLALVIALPAGAAWTMKVTGGGQARAGGTDFSITVSAKDTGSGDVTGQMEYSRSDLAMHASVKCLGFFNDGSVAVAAGPAKAQIGHIDEGAWMVVEIQEGGKGSGDRVRVRLMSQSSAKAVCNSPSGSFPGAIYDGNFNLRDKQ
jgi:hypothetical protein